MKTPTMFRSTANPRRTTLMHLAEGVERTAAERPEHRVELPAQTANPKRTIVMDAPAPTEAPV